MMDNTINVIGGGLAGCEAAVLLSRLGHQVRLFDMKPFKYTEAHRSPLLAELVCSNSLKSEQMDSAAGVLKREMRLLGSVLLDASENSRVPAGKALAVDRAIFANYVTKLISASENIEVVSQEVTELDQEHIYIVCTGPLSSPAMAEHIRQLTGADNMYFYDAIAPIVEAESVDMEQAFWADRYGEGTGDYLNCPMSEDEYNLFYDALLDGDAVVRREFEDAKHFESCMPVEALASRGKNTLTFGPMRPVGLRDPRTGQRPFAVVQLRKEDVEGSYLNMVGFQTRLRYPEQKRVFSMIPALHSAVFARYGSIHRNTFVNAPRVLDASLRLKNHQNIYLAGQLTGVEGYLESAASGLYAAICAASSLASQEIVPPPQTTALGALLNHLRVDRGNKFQPSNANFGIFETLGKRHPKKQRGEFYSLRAEEEFSVWLAGLPSSVEGILQKV